MEMNMDSQSAAPVPTSVSYGGFWLRVVAALIDGFLLGIASTVISLPFGANMWTSNEPNFAASSLSGLLGVIYYTVMESSSHQATLGKLAMGLKVTDLAGNRITWLRALGRYFAKILSAITLLIGYIMVAFTEKKQGLHDMIAGTLVVKK